MISTRQSYPKGSKLNLGFFKVVREWRNFCYTLHPHEIQIALMAINAKNSICPRWQFSGWRSFQVAAVWVAVVLSGSYRRWQLFGRQLSG